MGVESKALDIGADRFGEFECCRKSVIARENHSKFFSAIPVFDTTLSVASVRQDPRHSAENFIAHEMPKGVVDFLEMVDVNHDKNDTLLSPECASQVSLEATPVENSEQAVSPSMSELIRTFVYTFYHSIDEQ